jgi:hypothetical protein
VKALVLRRANVSRKGGHRQQDDFDVYDDDGCRSLPGRQRGRRINNTLVQHHPDLAAKELEQNGHPLMPS